MKIKSLICFVVLSFTACSSSEDESDCTKTITIPQFYFFNNQSYNYDISQEVSCNFPDAVSPELIEPPQLDNFTYTVVNFLFTPDTGNNTSRLQFEIELNNPNNYDVSGFPVLTISTDGLVSSGSFSNNASIPCYEINSNSNCNLVYDQQSSLDLGLISSVELIDVNYFLTN